MADSKPKKRAYNSKELTRHLRELAAEAHTIEDDGAVVTKGEALANLLFRKALGGVEQKVDDEGNVTEVPIKPEAWAIQLIYDRMEGKSPQAVPETAGKLKAKDKVGELAKSRINALSDDCDLKDQGPPPMSS